MLSLFNASIYENAKEDIGETDLSQQFEDIFTELWIKQAPNTHQDKFYVSKYSF